ncbi:UDP-glucose 4-epimerase GalE [Cucumibacter marinus]|uniref:UDP-glucose 4-epimerase GalE n=1 Tax=Cucumibacter marinus TaxID=1121252 RepID=UPI0003FE55D3|nr:UDP-glucose 4-epimerase GalE [Cucumibacter marinus]
MSVLVTGGAGYIGSHMVLRLADAGNEVVVLDNLVTGFDWAVDRRASFVEGDVGDTRFVETVLDQHNVEAILHFAGSIVVPESVENPLKYYRNNTANTRNLIEAAVNAGVKHMIFSSTAAVYGMTGNDPVSEDAVLNPMSPYGRSKLMSEMMLADVAAAHDLTYGVLRYFNVAGADPAGRSGQSTPRATHLIKVACQAALGQRDEMYIYGTDYDTSDGTGLRDYIHVTDLIEAHALLLEHLRGGGENLTLNCGYGHGYSVREVVDTVKSVSGVDFKAIETDRRAGDPAAVVAGADRIRKVLGWEPAHADLTEIVGAAYGWEKYLLTRNDRPEIA